MLLRSTFAKEEDLQVNEKVIEREISFLTSMSGLISDEELAELQKTWREDLIFQHQLEALLTEAVDISDAEAQEHYNHYQNQYDFSATFQLSHIDRKSTRLNSSHVAISYAVFCLKKKNKTNTNYRCARDT